MYMDVSGLGFALTTGLYFYFTCLVKVCQYGFVLGAHDKTMQGTVKFNLNLPDTSSIFLKIQIIGMIKLVHNQITPVTSHINPLGQNSFRGT